jgi:metal-responsive CopG/Arc/MetJ family transcriptional regulator
MKSTKKTFNISFPAELADQIDEIAKKQFATRSDFLRTAAVKYLREEQEFERLMQYGKIFGQKATYQSEEEVAADITKSRRKKESWRK